MPTILAFNGSPRANSNSLTLLQALTDSARAAGAEVETVDAHGANIKPCTGCLRCNMVKRCVIKGDDWPQLAEEILTADALVFATPVYFHHVSAPLKTIIDRFRSFLRVQITADGLIHTPHAPLPQRMALIQTQGSPDPADARPAEELFGFMAEVMGDGAGLTCLTGTRLAVPKQVSMSVAELETLYGKLGIPLELAADDHARNAALLEKARALGRELAAL